MSALDLKEESEKKGPLTNEDLYRRQMAMLKGCLERGAISREQYTVSASGLKQKMHLQPEE